MTATPEERAAARVWLSENTQTDVQALLDAVKQVYGDSIVAGQASALQTLGLPVSGDLAHLIGQEPDEVDWSGFWDAWEPGDPAAASLLADGGFSQLLEQAQVTVQGIAGATLDRMGTLLADGVTAGDSVDTIARSLRSVVEDPGRAQLIANTEVNRAVSAATMQTYQQAGVQQYEIVVSPEACDDCEALEDGNPYDLSDGDAVPPIHPGCRCTVVAAATGDEVDV